VLVHWLTSQLVEHESGESTSEKWWKNPIGFNYLMTGDEDEDPFQYAPTGPPPGWERLPFHEETIDGE
jgi:hypothetical protein